MGSPPRSPSEARPAARDRTCAHDPTREVDFDLCRICAGLRYSQRAFVDKRQGKISVVMAVSEDVRRLAEVAISPWFTLTPMQ